MIYSGIGNKWYNIAVIYLIWHMTILGLYDGPDSVMEAVQKYPHSGLAACSPDRLRHSPDLHRLNRCLVSISPEGRDCRVVYQSVVLDSFFRLRASPWWHESTCVWWQVFDDFDSLYQPPAFLLHANNGLFVPVPRCHQCTLHQSDRRDIGFLSSCPFQSVTGM